MKKIFASFLMVFLATSCAHVDRRITLPESVIEPSPRFFNQEKIGIPGINIAGHAENFESLLLVKRMGASFVRLNPSAWKSSRFPDEAKTFLLGKNQKYEGLIKEDVERLRTVLDWAALLDLKVVLSFSFVPGYKDEDAEKNSLFVSEELEKSAQQFFYDIALHLGGHNTLVAIQPIAKPAPEEVGILFDDDEKLQDWYQKVRASSQDLNLFYKRVVKSIRRARNQLPIILSAGLYGHPSAFTILEPVADDDIFYAFNWPLEAEGVVVNKENIDALLEPVVSWQKKYHMDNSRILVSSFDVNHDLSNATQTLKNLHDAFVEQKFIHTVAALPPNQFLDALSLKRTVFQKPIRAFLATDPDENSVKNLMASIKNKNLFDHGFDTIILDNSWQDPRLSDDKLLIAHPQKFPQGLKPIIAQAKSEKFTFGLQITMGTQDSSERLDGVLGYEKKNAKALADVGIDLLLLKDGFVDDSEEWDPELLYASLYEWHKELKNSRVLPYADTNAHEQWFTEFVSASRTPRSIRPRTKQGPIFSSNFLDEFSTIVDAARHTSKRFLQNSDRYINFPGYLYFGGPISLVEEKTTIAMWTIIGAPFIVAANPDDLNENVVGYLKNETLKRIAKDQHEPGRLLVDKNNILIFRKYLSTGEIAFLIVNLSGDKVTQKFTPADLNTTAQAIITSPLSEKNLAFQKENLEIVLAAHDSELLIVKLEPKKSERR